MKKVSIVTPVYKVEKYIGDCIQSVINQTYPSIELVLVDDCGGDKSVDIINDFISSTQKEGLEIKLIHHEHNQGVAAARSHAMQAATGDYIFCLDSDDMLKPECIDHLVKRMDETDADLLYVIIIRIKKMKESEENFVNLLILLKEMKNVFIPLRKTGLI